VGFDTYNVPKAGLGVLLLDRVSVGLREQEESAHSALRLVGILMDKGVIVRMRMEMRRGRLPRHLPSMDPSWYAFWGRHELPPPQFLPRSRRRARQIRSWEPWWMKCSVFASVLFVMNDFIGQQEHPKRKSDAWLR
jgi:hypothetical protein